MSTEQNEFATPGLIWGADAIAKYLGRTVKGTYNALDSGTLPGAKKIAGRWCLSVRVFNASFEAASAAVAA